MLDGSTTVRLLPELSAREGLIALRFAEGLTYREIGEALFIAPTTVRTHLAAIYEKLGVHSKTALVALITSRRAELRTGSERAQALSGPLVIAVLPFDNLSSEPRFDHLADCLTADSIEALARCPDVTVISRQTMLAQRNRHEDVRAIGRELNAAYLLEGSLQAGRGLVRIAAQLVETATGAQLWTRRFEEPVEDAFAMQDKVTACLSAALVSCGGYVFTLRQKHAREKHPRDMAAFDYYVTGLEQHSRFDRASNEEAKRLLRKAVEANPELVQAWILLGEVHGVDACNGFSADGEAQARLWADCTRRAIAISPTAPEARLGLAALNAFEGDLDGAHALHRELRAEMGNSADMMAMLADNMSLVEEAEEEALVLARRAIAANPRAPCYYNVLARSAFAAGEYDECLTALRQAPPDLPVTLLFTAAAAGLLDRQTVAREASRRLARDFPTFKVDCFVRYYPVTNVRVAEALREGARRAGVAL